MENKIPFRCVCAKGYSGGLCDKASTCIRCKSPKCEPGNKCDLCYSGWSGDYCNAKSCNNLDMCKNGGYLITL